MDWSVCKIVGGGLKSVDGKSRGQIDIRHERSLSRDRGSNCDTAGRCLRKREKHCAGSMNLISLRKVDEYPFRFCFLTASLPKILLGQFADTVS